jgi:two-component system, NtrC family, sensor kinase
LNLSYKFTEAQPDTLFVPFPSHPAHPPTIQDLPLSASCVDIHLSLGEVTKLFMRHPEWPGVILTDQGQLVGLLTRRACAEFLDNLLCTRIFSQVSIFAFFEKDAPRGLVLDGSISIPKAVRAALDRQDDSIHDPIVVCLGECQYGLLDMPVLLKAQAG